MPPNETRGIAWGMMRCEWERKRIRDRASPKERQSSAVGKVIVSERGKWWYFYGTGRNVPNKKKMLYRCRFAVAIRVYWSNERPFGEWALISLDSVCGPVQWCALDRSHSNRKTNGWAIILKLLMCHGKKHRNDADNNTDATHSDTFGGDNLPSNAT